MSERTDRNEALRLAVLMDAMDYGDTRKAAALLRQQAERIAELEVARAIDTFGHNVMAGRAQLQMVRLESRLQSLTAERDQLRAEVDELTHCLRAVLKGGDHLTGSQYAAVLNLAEAIAARTTHKETE